MPAMRLHRKLAETVRGVFGGLDIVFANAGVVDIRAIEQWDEAGFDRSIAINLKGVFFPRAGSAADPG